MLIAETVIKVRRQLRMMLRQDWRTRVKKAELYMMHRNDWI